MKKIAFLFLCFASSISVFSQVGIGTTTPNSNAKLDITDASKGLLIPRMDSVHRKAIPNTIGMLVYDSSYNYFYFNNGNVWQRISSSAGVVPAGQNAGDMLYWNGTSYAVLPVGVSGQTLHICNGQLTWSSVCVPPGMNLGTSPLQFNFDGIAAPLPTGIFAVTGANATSLGIEFAYTSGQNYHWGSVAPGPKSYASATGLNSATDSATQSITTNRAFGFRQTSSAGDPGAAFVFEFENTTGKTNFTMDFLLQSLDVVSPRIVTWAVDYGFGSSPVSFIPATAVGTLTTGGTTFSSNSITVNFGTVLNDKAGKVWVRVVALTGSTGSGNRPTSAIDNVKFTWN
ncbi:hypothetical protein BH10BAC3_BH10BAC3_01940 [soil metagenome]